MGATLVLAIWIASASTYQVALPFAGEYQIREFANADSGIDDFVKWVDTPAMTRSISSASPFPARRGRSREVLAGSRSQAHRFHESAADRNAHQESDHSHGQCADHRRGVRRNVSPRRPALMHLRTP